MIVKEKEMGLAAYVMEEKFDNEVLPYLKGISSKEKKINELSTFYFTEEGKVNVIEEPLEAWKYAVHVEKGSQLFEKLNELVYGDLN